MSYPELDWRVSFQEHIKHRKSLFETTLTPRGSVKSTEDLVPERTESCKFQFIRKLINHLSNPGELHQLLEQKCIDLEQLYELEPHPQLISRNSFLPLEWFDDFEYDPMSAARWLSVDNLQAFALVLDPQSGEWDWKTVTVVDYDDSRYLWTVMENGDSWTVPRVRCYFVHEDPFRFCQRVQTALNSRTVAENYLRYNYLRQLVDVEEYFDMPENMQKRLDERSSLEVLEAFNSIYRKFHITLSLNACLEQNTWLNIQPVQPRTLESPSSPREGIRKLYNYGGVRSLIKRIIMVCHPAVVVALEKVHQECELVRAMEVFSLNMKAAVTLMDFKSANEAKLSSTMWYLQNNWIETTTMQVHQHLLTAGRGWFDIGVTDWSIYQFMKLFRLTEQIKYRMQTALRDLALTSTENYIHRLCDPCSLALTVEEDFSWQGNLIDSPFETVHHPAFYVLLEMNEDFPHYSTPPDEFPPLLEAIFDEAIARTHDVHVIDPSLFGSLIFDPELYLSSIGLIDPVIQQRRDLLVLSYRKILIPLKAYTARYMEFKELFFTNVLEYVEAVKLNKTSLQVKEEISFQIRMRESLERTVPMSIVIGAFWIDVKPLREALILKRVELTTALLQMLTERLRNKTADIVSEYNEIIEKMCEKPVSIEHIYEIREFMETIPELLQRLEERMKTVMFEYEILDHFRYALTDADFYQKWHALALPQTILKQMDSVVEFHEGEVDKFRKQQVSDEAGFASRVEEVNVNISKFTTVYDIQKVMEISIEVKKLWKSVKELIQYGETLNNRQQLFEMPPIDLSNLFELKESFESYKKLWTLAAEYINVEESWRENPLSSIEIETVAKTLSHYKDSLEELVGLFMDQPQIAEVVQSFVERVKSFEPYLKIIKLLQHPILEAIHWGQFTKAAGIRVKLSLAANFALFLEQHIEDHLDVLLNIIVTAEEQKEEFERIQAEKEEERRKEEEYMKNRELRRLLRTEI